MVTFVSASIVALVSGGGFGIVAITCKIAKSRKWNPPLLLGRRNRTYILAAASGKQQIMHNGRNVSVFPENFAPWWACCLDLDGIIYVTLVAMIMLIVQGVVCGMLAWIR